jgi:hypothetical protein
MSHNQLLPGNKKKRKSLTTTTSSRTTHGTDRQTDRQKASRENKTNTNTSVGSSCYRRSVLTGNFTKFSEI